MEKPLSLDNVVTLVGTTATITASGAGGAAGGGSRNQKILIGAIAVGIALAAALTAFLRRPAKTHASHSNIKKNRGRTADGLAKSVEGNGATPYDIDPGGSRGANGSVASTSRSRRESKRPAPSATMSVSSRHSDSTLVSNPCFENDGPVQLTCSQMGLLGIESLEKCIRYWEDSVAILRTSTDYNLPEDEQRNPDGTLSHLEKILESAHQLQKLTEDLFLDEESALYEGSERGLHRLKSASSMDSFMSAEDFLSDDEDIRLSLQNAGFSLDTSEINQTYPLYEAARRLVEAGTVPYRSLKTEMVSCKSDQEYLAKLHCLRGAFSRLVADVEKRHWIAENGKEVLKEIMIRADRDPTDFEQTFDNFVSWSQEPGNWVLTESELKDRGLRALTFYDIVLDFIFLDAFEDLEAPPASVLAVTQNRWLSNSFKETALCTAVWSVLKTKRRWLRYKDGFIAHFYDLSEHLMPTLAWGFLGPHTELQDLCIFFKEKFLDFLQAIFSFDRVQYTTLDELCADVMSRMEEMHLVVMERLQLEPDDD